MNPIPTPTLPLKALPIKLSGDSVNHVGWAVPTIMDAVVVGTAHPTSHSLNLMAVPLEGEGVFTAEDQRF